MRSLYALGLASCLAGAAAAQTVVLSGMLGQSKALLLIDGQPHTLAAGASARGVTLRRVGDGEVDVEVGGRSATLRMGGAPARLGGAASPSGGQEIVLSAGPGGHFLSTGQINGQSVRFMVDTGATAVAISQSEAVRIGLDFKNAPRSLTSTAGGTVPVHQVVLNAVRLGEVEVYQVQAVVLPAEMPFVLLGNSFLSRFSMQRDNDVMRLRRRP